MILKLAWKETENRDTSILRCDNGQHAKSHGILTCHPSRHRYQNDVDSAVLQCLYVRQYLNVV